MPLRITTDPDACVRKRILAGYSVQGASEAVARKGGKLSASAIRNLERGVSQARPGTLKFLADAYGCDIADLIREHAETAA